MQLTRELIEDIINDPKKCKMTAVILAGDFQLFIKYVHFAINESPFTFRPFHFDLIKTLEKYQFGKNEKRNLGICVPVGAGKSLIVEYFIAWSFCRDISNAFVYTSHAQRNIEKLSREIREMFTHEFLYALFGLELKNDEKGKVNWSFKGGKLRTGLMARPTGAGLTGADAGNPSIPGFSGALIVDDPHDQGRIRSEVNREEVIRFYDEKLATRRRTPTTPSIVIMQRLHKDDLIGWLMKNQPQNWEFFVVPAIDENGESFYPERFPLKELTEIRSENAFKFHSQYQQNPISVGGNIIKSEWFKYYDELPQFRRIFITTDTAQTVKQSSDYTVLALWGKAEDGLYLIDLKRGKWEAYDLRKEAEAFWRKWGDGINGVYCAGFYVESKVSGIGLIQELNRIGLPMIPTPRGEGVAKDKLFRLEAVLNYIYSGKVFLPKDKYFIPDFIEECEAFTRDDTHKHDDQVDVLVDAISIGLSVANLTLEDIL